MEASASTSYEIKYAHGKFIN